MRLFFFREGGFRPLQGDRTECNFSQRGQQHASICVNPKIFFFCVRGGDVLNSKNLFDTCYIKKS
jgi:hypothetical protein